MDASDDSKTYVQKEYSGSTIDKYIDMKRNVKKYFYLIYHNWFCIVPTSVYNTHLPQCPCQYLL